MTDIKYTYEELDVIAGKINAATGLTPASDIAVNKRTQEIHFTAQLSPTNKTNLDNFMNTEGFVYSSQVPRIDSITPAWGDSDDVVPITNLAGEGFTGASAVKLKKLGESDLVASALAVVSDVKITCTVDLTGLASGAWDVEVTCSDGTKVTLPGGFVVSGCITGITPAVGHDLVSITDLAGVGLTDATAVEFIQGGSPTVAATNIVIVSDTQITCDIDLSTLHLGLSDVRVTLADGTKDQLPACFTVVGIDSITPDTGHNDNAALSITNLSGLGLTGATDARLKMAGQPDIVGSTFTVVGDTQITCDFDLTGAQTGAWDVEVTLLDTTKVTLPAAFLVIGIDDIAPIYGVGNDDIDVTIGGGGFTGATVATLKKLGETDIVATGFIVTDDNTIACNFDITGATVGLWDVEVTLVDASTVTMPVAFDVIGLVTSVAPSTGHKDDAAVAITDLEGSGFTGATLVQLTKTGHTTIDCSAIVVVNDNKITCAFDLTGAVTGKWNVVVTLVNSAMVALPDGFTIVGVDSIAPDTGEYNAPIDVVITGVGFTGATVATLKKLGKANIVGTSFSVLDDDNIGCNFEITGAAAGAWDVEITLADLSTVTLVGGFTVTHSA